MAFSHTTSTMTLSFLRPMALPRPSTINHFLSLSLSKARLSTTTSPILSSPTIAAQAAKPYHILLTPSKQYPVYTLHKRGGNMKLTKIRRIEGDVNILRKELQEALGVEEKEVVVNQLTRHIIVKGHKKPEIVEFLKEKYL